MGNPEDQSELIGRLRTSSGRMAEDAMSHCESLMPFLPAVPGRVRAAGVDIIRCCVALRLDLAQAGREATPEEEAHVRRYFRDAADRGLPLDIQLEVIRRTIAYTIHRYWELAGPELTDEMLAFTSRTSRFHHRLENILVDTYCQRLGTDVAAERLRKAHADALLDGALPPPTGGAVLPLASSYLLLAIAGDAGQPPPLAALAGDDSVLHTVRDRIDIVLLPAGTEARETAEKVTLRARDAGRTAAAAVRATSSADVPAALAEAKRLLDIAPAMPRRPVLLTPQDALPERLLLAAPEIAAELRDLVDRLAATPGLTETVDTFLDTDLDRSATAERLHIHRRTLTQRFHRIREVTGYDPRSSRGVQIFGLALAARRLGSARGTATPP